MPRKTGPRRDDTAYLSRAKLYPDSARLTITRDEALMLLRAVATRMSESKTANLYLVLKDASTKPCILVTDRLTPERE